MKTYFTKNFLRNILKRKENFNKKIQKNLYLHVSKSHRLDNLKANYASVYQHLTEEKSTHVIFLNKKGKGINTKNNFLLKILFTFHSS